jgi:hypothetical protein
LRLAGCRSISCKILPQSAQNRRGNISTERDQMAKRITLSPKKIEHLKPAEEGKRYQMMDALVPGFGVRVTDKGVKTYILQTRFPGSSNPVRREIGKCGVFDLDEARNTARDWLKSIKQGIDPALALQEEREENIKKRTIPSGAWRKITSLASSQNNARGRPSRKGSEIIYPRFSGTGPSPRSPIWISSARS